MQKTQEMWVWSLGQEDALGEEMATRSSILAWKIPWTEGPGRLDMTEQPSTHAHTLVLSFWPEDWGWWAQQKCCRLDFTSNIWKLSSAMVLSSCNSKRSPHVRIIPSSNVLATVRLAAHLQGKASTQWEYMHTIIRTYLHPWKGDSEVKSTCQISKWPGSKRKWLWEVWIGISGFYLG